MRTVAEEMKDKIFSSINGLISTPRLQVQNNPIERSRYPNVFIEKFNNCLR